MDSALKAYKLLIIGSGGSVYVHGVGYIRPHAPVLIDSMYLDTVKAVLRSRGYKEEDYIIEEVVVNKPITRVGSLDGNELKITNFISRDRNNI